MLFAVDLPAYRKKTQNFELPTSGVDTENVGLGQSVASECYLLGAYGRHAIDAWKLE